MNHPVFRTQCSAETSDISEFAFLVNSMPIPSPLTREEKKNKSSKLHYGSARVRSALAAHVHYVKSTSKFQEFNRNLFAFIYLWHTDVHQLRLQLKNTSHKSQIRHRYATHTNTHAHTRMKKENPKFFFFFSFCARKNDIGKQISGTTGRASTAAQSVCHLISCAGGMCGMPVSVAIEFNVAWCLLSAFSSVRIRNSIRSNLEPIELKHIYERNTLFISFIYFMLTQRVVYGN